MGILGDLRFAVRMLSKRPGLALTAVLTIALGVSVNTTVFTIVNAALINGLPFDNPREIVGIGWQRGPLSYPDYLDFQQQSHSFKGLAVFSTMSADLSDERIAAERVNGAMISANLFPLLGQPPKIGRGFTPDDEKPGAAPVALLSHYLWQSRYGGKPDVVGLPIRVNLQTYTIVGVLPEDEAFPAETRVWLPIVRDESRSKRASRDLSVVGRLGAGVSIQQATAELKTIAGRLAETYPTANNKDMLPSVEPYTDRNTRGPIRVMLWSMQGAVGFVLLIACSNVANLLLSRALDRTRESSIRTALGASRWRVVRQLLIESVMLSFMGGALGLGLAVLGVRWFDAATADTGKPYWIVFNMDYNVFAYLFFICLLSGVLFGLAPALQISKSNVNENLRDGARGSTGGVRTRRTTAALLVGEICLTLVLLVGAGLMMRSFMKVWQFSIGVKTENLVTAQIQPAASKYPQPENRLAFVERLTERLSTIPGLDAVTIASQPPAGGAFVKTLQVENRDIKDKNNRLPNVDRIAILPDYFQALQAPVIQGRSFTVADGIPGSEVAIVNGPFVAKYFPGEMPIGKRIRLGEDWIRGADDPKAPWLTIIGIGPPIFQRSPDNDLSVQPTVYVPYRQESTIAFTVLARSPMPADRVIAAIRNELKLVDRDLPLYNIRTLDELVQRRRWPFRVFGTLFASFGLIALAISTVGIYGVTAHGVSLRTQEIGVRMALGAQPRDVMWLVLRQGLRRIAIGLVLGLGAAFGLSRVLGSLLVNMSATDPATFVSISVLLSLVTVSACVIPARRAMRLDPMEALRVE